jgi:RNA polymerase sigma factor (sigma-70 family)
MAGNRSDRVPRQVHRLFHVGAVGTMSDAQLLERFVSCRDETAEAAFEELVTRHGPMVLRVCRGVLRDAHDAEDAFQAVFLVLANRARAIRRSGSVASWLFGVAHRVAHQGKRTAARRRALDQHAAERNPESGRPVEVDPDQGILHEEIHRLPDRLRAPVVLCYLQGLTYDAAGHQLGLSETAVRGRLARARERLRHRLTRRGVTVPAGLLAAGAVAQAQAHAAIPEALVRSTLRIALGFLAGNSAAILARGVLNAMLLDQLRIATVLVCLGLGGSYWAWQAVASIGEKARPRPAPIVVARPEPPPPARTDRYGDPLPAGASMRLGTARFRQPQEIRHIVFSPDGRRVATDNGQRSLLISDARDGKPLRSIEVGLESLWDLAFSPDGKVVAASGFRLNGERNTVENQVALADVATGRILQRLAWDAPASVYKTAYTADGKTLASVSGDGTLRLWDLATAKLVREEQLAGDERFSPEAVVFSPDAASHLLAIQRQNAIDLWDFANVRRVRGFGVGGGNSPTCLVFSPDGKVLAGGVASRGAEILLWGVNDGALLRRIEIGKDDYISTLAFSPDGKVLATVGNGRPLAFFDIATGKRIHILSEARMASAPLTFSPDGKTLAATGDRQSMHFWDLATGRDRLATPEAHEGDVTALACLPDGKTLVTGSRDRTVRLWDVATGRPTGTLPHEGWVETVSLSADGSRLATHAGYPEWGKIRVWDLGKGEPLRAWSVKDLNGGSHLLRGLLLTEDGASVIAALSDGSLHRWDVATGQERSIAQPKLEKLPGVGPAGAANPDQVQISRAIFSRNGRTVAMMGDEWVQVVDVASGERRFKERTTSFGACAVSPNGGSLAIGRIIRTEKIQAGHWSGFRSPTSAIVWLDSQTGDRRREFVLENTFVRSLAFSPDGQDLAVGTSLEDPPRGIIRVYRLRTRREIRTIESPCPWVETLTFTPDGKQIVAGLADTSIVIWDVHPSE